MLDIERIDHISDEMRAVVESEWPELAHKLPPKNLQGVCRQSISDSWLGNLRECLAHLV